MSKAQHELSELLQAHLPSFLDEMANHRYKNAKDSVPLEQDGNREWRHLSRLLHMWADCESTYHKMTYLQPEYLYKDTLRSLYLQLKTQSLVCADLLHFHRRDKAGSESDVDKVGPSLAAIAAAAKCSTPTVVAPSGYYDSLRFSWQSDQTFLNDNPSSAGSVASNLSEFDQYYEGPPSVRIIEYKTFLDQCSRYFEQRLLLVSFYLGLAREKPHVHYLFDYKEKEQSLENIQHALRTLEHPFFHALQTAATMEVQTIRAALKCEMMLSQYNYLHSIMALHKLKQQLGAWADLLDQAEDDDDESPDGTTSDLRISRTSRNSDRVLPTPPGRLSLESKAHLTKPHPIAKLLKRGESSSNVLQPSAHSLSCSNSQHAAPFDDAIVLPLFRWSKKFYQSLVAKFTLYFYKWLDQMDGQLQPRGILPVPKAIVNHVGLAYTELIDTFFSRHFLRDHSESAQLLLVLDSAGLPGPFHAKGYLCPSQTIAGPKKSSANRIRAANKTYFGKVSRYDEDIHGEFAPLWGVASFPVVYCYPKAEPPEHFVPRHFPNLVGLLQDLPPWDAKAKTAHTSPITIHHEKKPASTYAIARVDACVYLTLIFEKRKQGPSDKVLQDLLVLLLSSLQHTTVFR
ncbi:hypothetical protein, variant [Saprolegnia diclina VS20]|uniref:Uncharacterized protein n=1 Tax=Saprolegnia diclina (strain VS20) TaxID=1156394 RepID=T0Q579_SAPDV|nr:hypothetical protein, variant [Saprolegnia diclina VS20]EQC32964.1 hypothetical protein, variant [Saprolegnia diclina VS20]|eukprot:XP_008613650.1 hypothetical protein, variant [Saprolegnia diclina VS20]